MTSLNCYLPLGIEQEMTRNEFVRLVGVLVPPLLYIPISENSLAILSPLK